MTEIPLLVAVQALADEVQDLRPEVQVGHDAQGIYLYVPNQEWFENSRLWDCFQDGYRGYRVRVRFLQPEPIDVSGVGG